MFIVVGVFTDGDGLCKFAQHSVHEFLCDAQKSLESYRKIARHWRGSEFGPTSSCIVQVILYKDHAVQV